MAQKFVKKWFEPGEIDGEIVKIKEGQSLKAMEGGSEVDLIKIESGKVMLKGAEAALQSDISALESDIETALNSAKSYADGKISDLVNGAPVALDTLKELADKLGEEESALNALITQVDENLQDAKDYTDAQIAAIPAVDLSSLETIANVDSKDAAKLVEAKAYTDAQIAAIPPVDLSGFYTKSEVDSKESALDSRLDVVEPKVSSLESSASSLQSSVSSLESSVSSLQSSISSEVSRAEAAEQALDGRLDILEPKMVSVESDIADLEGADLDLRDDLNQEISDRQSADAAKLVEAKAYTDSKIAAIPSTDLSGFYTKSEIDSKESALDSKISTEKDRVDAILSASQADKDTFAEIVQLINQVDTTNDQAFAAFALATNDSLDALDGRLDTAEPKISTLETKVSSLESEMDQAQSDLGSLDGRLGVAEPKISSLESNMSTAQSNISTLQGKVSVLESEMDQAQSDISSAQADISALETDVASLMGVVAPEVKEDEEIIPSVLTHVDLEKEALKIYKVCVGRVSVFKNVDYSVSVVGGKTRLTWIGDMASGGSHPVALSDKIYCTYLHAGSVPGEGGGSGGGGSQEGIFYSKNFSDPLESFESLGGTSNPQYIEQPNITNGVLNFKSNYSSYGTAFVVDLDMGNKIIETNTTYKIKLTGTASLNSQMRFKFGRNEDPAYGWQNAVMKDADGNSFWSTAFTDGVLEFYTTTDSEILTVDQYQKFLIFLDWSYQESSVSISSIEITKV